MQDRVRYNIQTTRKLVATTMKLHNFVRKNQVALVQWYRSSSWSFGHCGIYMWAAASETEDRYTVSHMLTPWQRPCSLRSLVWITTVEPGHSVIKKKKKRFHLLITKSVWLGIVVMFPTIGMVSFIGVDSPILYIKCTIYSKEQKRLVQEVLIFLVL